MRSGGDWSTSSASAAASSSSSSSGSGCRMDRMLEVEELDAARALADFAQIALLEREGGGGGRGGGGGGGSEWRNTGRRSNKRIRNGAEEGNLEEGTKGSGLRPFYLDLNQHALPEEEHSQQETKEDVAEEKLEPQMNCELSKTRTGCSSSRLPFGVGRTKPDLTEAEKEAKRLHRVLANRESARKTIRRRQALCEELTRKAAELSLDNKKMKREKENALKEYLLLNDTNRHLKEKMAERIKDEASTQLELETPISSSTNHPLVMHQRSPFIQFACPPIGWSLNPMKSHSNSINSNPSHEEGTYGIATGPMSPFYIPPYLWFYPVIQQQGGGFSLVNTCASSETGGEAMEKELGSSTAFLEEQGASLSYQRRSGITKTAEVITNVHDMLVRVPSSLGVAGCSSLDVKIESEPNQPGRGDAELLPGAPEEQPPKKVVDAAVAAEARKRRKELTKLKRHHGRGP